MGKQPFTLAAIAIAVACLTPRAARAAPYTYLGQQATVVFHQSSYFSAGPNQVSTANLSPGADTVLHILDPSGNDIAHNDDCGYSILASCVSFTALTAGYYTILVYAYAPAAGGTADVLKNGVGAYYTIPVVGTVISGLPSGFSYQYETALVPNGASDTMLWGFDCSTGPGKVIAANDDGGVGLGSLLVAGSTGPVICKVLLGAYSSATTGAVNFYVNDVPNDGDGDGLGAGLEYELRTCDPRNGGSYCSGVFNAQDTDRDGIPDAYEVFGKDTHSGDPPLHLPRWGASPRHKDIFIEADWYGTTSQPMTTTDAADLAASYAAGSASDLKNPDGIGGVALHIDLGVASTGTLYGNWGGASLANTSAYVAAANDSRNFAPNRIGIFHYQLFNVTASGGQSPGAPADRYFISAAGGIAHELGHNNNLSHSGTPSSGVAPWVGGPVSYPGGQMDCKPQYSSLMSYAGGSTTFSLGTNPLITNPSNVRELGNSFPGGNGSWLSMPPWIYPIDSSHTQVDWNRDGSFADAAAGGDRAMTTAGNYCTESTRNLQSIDSPRVHVAATPKLLKLGSRLYAFWINAADHNIHYVQGAVSGPDANGSCPGGSTYNATCMTFGADTTIGAGFPVYSFSAIVAGTSVQFAVVNSANTIRTLHSSGADGSGNLTGFVTDPLEIAGTVGEPELARTFDSSGSVIGLYYRDSSGWFEWETLVGSTWTWRGFITDSSGTALSGAIAPSVASTSNRTCGVFPDSSRNLRFHCLDVTTNHWTDYTSQMFARTGGSANPQTAKVGLAFHIPRDKTGAPMYGDPSVGEFWMMTVSSGASPRSLLLYTSNKLSSTIMPGSSMQFNWWAWTGSYWDDVQSNTGVALYEDSSVSALKGLLLGGVDGSGNSQPFLMPFVDGTINETQTDINDFQVMERGICLGTRTSIAGEGDHTSFCGSINSWGY